MNNIESIDVLDKIIVGRVTPHIYAFSTNTIPSYLKIGDTYRSVSHRLKEWQEVFPNLEKQYEKGIINTHTDSQSSGIGKGKLKCIKLDGYKN